jgi:PAS domain-containing protein
VDQVTPALQQFLTEFKRVASAIVDSYFIVDTERRIVDFNRAFFALLPRQLARGLKGKRCYEVIELNICKGVHRSAVLEDNRQPGSTDQRPIPAPRADRISAEWITDDPATIGRSGQRNVTDRRSSR